MDSLQKEFKISIEKNLEKLKSELNILIQKMDDHKRNIQLIAVSKFQSVDKIEQAYRCGIRDFGENYIQEWLEKQKLLSHLPDIRWHIIGALQKNKVKFLNENIYCLQSLNSIDLAKKIEKTWTFHKPLGVMIQIQVDKNDVTKSGLEVKEALDLFHYVLNSKNLDFKGFMGIGPNILDQKLLKIIYTQFINICQLILKSYEEDKNQLSSVLDKVTISLGMSQDYSIAIECGSNMIRIGSLIFGSRT